jgi:hypothetical protein
MSKKSQKNEKENAFCLRSATNCIGGSFLVSAVEPS